MSLLREIREKKNMTQKQTAELLGISLRSYVSYENDISKEKTPKYRFLIQEMERINLVDEEHGVLTVNEIVNICENVFRDYPVNYCYLFGSYAKNKATETSDVDLLISCELNGIMFYELVEKLREDLHKKVDVLDSRQLLGNEQLINEVLKYGFRIYGNKQE